MNDFGTVIEPGAIRFERLLPGPVERVWTYLTDPARRARWLAGGPMELRHGGTVDLCFRNTELSPQVQPPPAKYAACAGDGATTHGHVTRCEPPRLLSFTWAEGEGEPSEVTFELAAKDEMVQLVLTHRRLRSQGERLSVAGGWHVHLDILAEVLDGRTPGPFWPRLEQVEAVYAPRLAEPAPGQAA